ncbi:hypothetical protein SAMN04515674_10988 [Pseudarcicella hirudinis]|uniref:Lipoprotein n=1 Tax=Pseudarcicella hirudinis TaxID=1079859 RepID=A0A1I5VFV4_9BACT|nr:hypothetical protein [Pseudarcicella hirudinis]SFQ06271.1 hypothetical protein SAMN04515674_10988 [Pseudarcicella hirudinis]
MGLKLFRFFLFFGTIVLYSCSEKITLPAKFSSQLNYCAPTINYQYDSQFFPITALDSFLLKNPEISQNFTQHDILVANAIGVLPTLQKILTLKKDSSLSVKLEKTNYKLFIQKRLLITATAIDGLASEIDCEGERADQLAGYLDNLNDKRNRRLTVASIIAGSATTVATVLLDNGNAQNLVGIGGGLLSATLGGLTAFPSHKKIVFKHVRNILTDIWQAPVSSNVYPPSIWYMLNDRHFSNSGNQTILANIKNRWISYEFEGKADLDEQDLLFKTGGMYKADDLHSRANLLNQLQATIRSLHQDLYSFSLHLNSLE